MLSNISIIFGLFCTCFAVFISLLLFGFNHTLKEYNKKSEELIFLNEEIERCKSCLKTLTDRISYSKNRLTEIDFECFEKSLSKKNKK